MDNSLPRYQQVQQHIRDRIAGGEWAVDQRIPSEHELVAELGVSRMTVNRAVRELTDQGILRRVQGLGTFVADPRPQATLLEIRNIADEIRARGGDYSCELVRLGETPANDDQAAHMNLAPGDVIFHSLLVHCENGVPIQLEDRLVNPAVGPDYLDVDFAATTPNEYLMKVAPLANVEHIVDAVMPEADTRELLRMPEGEPCLLLHRRTWALGTVASLAWLTHPSSRYRLRASFSAEDARPYQPFQSLPKGAFSAS